MSEASLSKTSHVFAFGTALILTFGQVADTFAESIQDCRDWSRPKMVKVLEKASFGEARLMLVDTLVKAGCMKSMPEEDTSRCKYFSKGKDGKAIFRDCKDNRRVWQSVDPFADDGVEDSRYFSGSEPPPSAPAQMGKASGFSAGDSAAAEEIRKLRKELAQARDAEIVRRANQ